MEQYKIINAYKALTTLGSANIPLKTAYKIFMLKKKIEPIFIFRMEKEKALLSELHGTVDENGTIHFNEMADAVKFRNAVDELNELEAEIDFEPISVSLEQMSGINMKPNDIEKLEGFIEFEDGGDWRA